MQIHLIQGVPVPSIPEGIENESTLAVLFLILLGIGTLWYALRQAPAIIAAWKATGAREAETTRTVQALEKLAAEIAGLRRDADRMAAAAGAETEESRAVRGHIHKLVTPAISGLAVAYLRLAGYPELARKIHEDNPDAVIPITPKVRGPK